MEFADPPRHRRGESIVPMINVVFLLLIFFLMTAQIAPPDPFEVTVPAAEAEVADSGPLVIYLGPDGAIAFADLTGPDAVAAVAAQTAEGAPVFLRADRDAQATLLAQLLAQLGTAGVTDLRLITSRP